MAREAEMEPAFKAKVRAKGQNKNRKKDVGSEQTNNQEVHQIYHGHLSKSDRRMRTPTIFTDGKVMGSLYIASSTTSFWQLPRPQHTPLT